MPLNVRSIAVSISVIFFFSLGFISWISGLSPFTCCKRALLGAVITYIAATLGAKAINNILTSAMITSRVNQNLNKARSKRKDKISDNKD
jgi:hypothetical protein